MKVCIAGSWLTSGEASAPSVEGTLWMALAKSTTALVSVVRNCTNRHAAFCFWLVLAMPTMVPVM